MPFSVENSSGGSGMSNLLRKTRLVKPGDQAGASAGSEPTAGLRPLGRTAIDSTGAKTAQVAATLTVVMGRLGSDPVAERPYPANQPTTRSAASDLLRVLDGYTTDPMRLSA